MLPVKSGSMEKRLVKSVIISDTHQLVLDGDFRLDRALSHANSLLAKYGRRKPLQFALCCVAFLVYLGKHGYKHGHDVVISAYLLTNSEGQITADSFRKRLTKMGHTCAGAMVIPGFNLEHYPYDALNFMRIQEKSPLEKVADTIEELLQERELSKRPPEVSNVKKAITRP